MSRALCLLIGAVLLVPVGTAAPAAGEGLQLPDLKPRSSTVAYNAATDELWFHTHVENHGEYAFEVLGSPHTDGPSQYAHADQCVRWADPRVHVGSKVCAEYQRIGRLVWHAEHRHLHLDGLARYTLFHVGEDGSLSEVRSSDKVGFCLTDTWPLRYERFPQRVHPLLDPALDDQYGFRRTQTDRWYFECTYAYGVVPWPSLRMGISPGWKDIYNGPVPGQQFPVGDLPDGQYRLRTRLNTSDSLRFREVSLDDNEHWLDVCLHRDAQGRRQAREGAC
ncbi:MAG TPA: hypothetical protein VNU01_02835 [Egibacteraceae bacterium]|nr:hypothetical protein [Egibacteraceae bacterium]